MKKTDWVFKSGSHTFLWKTEDGIRDPSGDVDLKYLTRPGKMLEVHASLRKSNLRKPKLDLVLAQWLPFLLCTQEDCQMKRWTWEGKRQL